MPQEYKKKLQEYNDNKAEGLERIRQNAQSAFVRAQSEKAQGNIIGAARWMDRAHRLAKHNPNITFDLVMLKLKQKQYHEAYALLNPLMKKFDFYEGWLVLGILLSAQQKLSQSVQKLHYALSHYCPTSETWEIIRNIVKDNGEAGCCGIIGSLGQVWIANNKNQLVSVFLDNELIAKTKEPCFSLPSGWEECSYLHIEYNGHPLIGSPVDLQAILRTEGFVESNGHVVSGWLWYPAEPTRIPTLHIYDPNGKHFKQMQALEEFEVATLEIPLFRAKIFSMPRNEFYSGLFSFEDDYGRRLTGSPIDPVLLWQKTPRFRNIVKKHQHYIPVSAFYKGNAPQISQNKSAGVVIVIPIYKGREETIACVLSVLATLPKGFIIQLVNDCSPDIELVEWLEKQVDHKHVFLINHLENMGFPSAVNTGMQAWPDYDVILLNSDTLVSNGWAEGLKKAAYLSKNIATVTPFSNDASIFSYPYHDTINPVPSLEVVQHFMCYMQKLHEDIIIDIPTAHGFCMFIRRDCILQIGLFRENLFAQGYGEENDFCMRAQHLGWKHVLAAGIFVGHKGGVSFQSSKTYLLKRNIAILNHLYPHYDEMVMDYIDRDFLRSIRREVDLYRLQLLEEKQASLGKTLRYALFITHIYGGGVERAVQDRANEMRLKNIIPIFIRPTVLGEGCRIEILFKSSSMNIEYVYPNLVFDLPSEYILLVQFLSKLFIVTMEIHHFAGHHAIIRNLLQDLDIEYDMHLHDYMSFCPRISLINKDQLYCGEPRELSVCQKCIASEVFDEDKPIKMTQWIKRSKNEFNLARSIIVPSEDTANRIYKHFPQISEIQVKNLEDDRPDLSLKQLAYFSENMNNIQNKSPQNHAKRFRVCIIGAIGIEKGFNILQDLVTDSEQRDIPIEFVLVGRTVDDRLFIQTDRLFITGSYKEEEAVSLVMQQQADIAFFPAIWPETWCYALSIAWRAGLKTVAFDLGAIAQRIKNTQRGWVLSSLMTIPEQNDVLLDLCKETRM